MKIIDGLLEQIHGTYNFTDDEKGLYLKFRFPKNKSQF